MTQELNPKNLIDLVAARNKLAQDGGKRFWQSLEELSDTPQYRDFLENEFPSNADPSGDGIDRRDVLKLMAASAAMTGLSACTKLPTEKIVPYVKPPEELVAGRPLFYATSMMQDGVSTGVLVESHLGRPTKVEGNSEHPGSLGGSDVFLQASILTMYDPDRSQTVMFQGRPTNWNDFGAAMGSLDTGAGVRILTKTVTSPTLGAQLRDLMARFPGAKWHQYEPCGSDGAREGLRLAFGKPVNPVYHFEKADVVVSLDSDFLTAGPGHVRYARDFSSRRNLEAGPATKLNRLYAVESMPTATGSLADHRWPLRSGEIEGFARQLAAALGVSAPGGAAASKIPADAVSAMAKDLMAHRGASLIVAGETQPPFVHALAAAMNAALGNAGTTVTYTDTLEANPVDQMDSLRDLVNDLNAGKVQLLVILGGNPVYDAPADLNFATALLQAKLRIHTGLYNDETAQLCHWHLPSTHYLESWSDGRAYDGTMSIVQPLIAPLYQGRSFHEVIALLMGDQRSGYDIVRAYWQSQRAEKGRAFDVLWETSLHDGLVAGTAMPAISAAVRPDFAAQAKTATASDSNAMEVVFRRDPAIGDGEWANNGWLQELPKPITRLTWDNAAMISPATAQQLALTTGDYVKLQISGGAAEAGVFIVPGHADNSVTLHLGYGRQRAGNVGNGPGFSAYLLRTSSAPWIASGLQISKTGKDFTFAPVQHQYTIDREGHLEDEESVNAFQRDLVQIATFEEFQQNPSFAQNSFAQQEANENITIYPGFKYNGYAWGMSIDLNRCVGCNACVIACQSENNIAVVGKDQVIRGRSMHWIRIDTYFRGSLDNPEMYYEPLPCMQCENAPCEYVCPVGATTHSPEGLNDMTYNRCVGTRYCSNNCPYKVRRFNFYLYSDFKTPSLFGMRNPNVTVRSRGVMEKCTYCVQRINAAKIRTEEEGRTIRDGEIVTACQQACPAEAIVFGNINDPNSRVAKLKAQSRNYGLLEDLNTRPRTTYLARVRNPNPEIRA